MRSASLRTNPHSVSHTKSRTAVPRFALYGERDAGSMMLHIEDIQERSRLYQWDISPHLHSNLYQIVVVLSGPVQVSLDDQRYAGSEPMVAVMPIGVVHSFHFAPDTEGYVLTLNTQWPKEGDMELAEAYRVLFAVPRIVSLRATGATGPRIDNVLRDLMSEFRQPDGSASPVTGWLARTIIWRLAQWLRVSGVCQTETAPQQSDTFNRFRLLVEAHFTEHWEVGRYAGMLSLTAERLNRLCKQQAGVTAFEIIRERLLREACRRLIYIVVPVSQLAYELGFADAGYFCRFFKRLIGMSPNQYRKKHSGYELDE